MRNLKVFTLDWFRYTNPLMKII